jgi:hypothetical protein
VRFFCVIGVMSGVGVIQASLITSQSKAHWWFYYQLARNMLTIATVITLYRFGVSRIAFALMMQVLLLWPITLVMVSKLIRLPVGEYFGQFLRPLIAVMAMVGCVAGIGALMPGQLPPVRLVVEILAGAAAYGILIVLLCRDRMRKLWDSIKSTRVAH